MTNRRLCPVCRLTAWPTESGLRIVRHRDKAGRLCPASGYPLRITDPDVMEAAS